MKEEVTEIVKGVLEACLERFTVPAMLSVDEVAEKLNISKETVRAYIKSGELQGHELGARLMRIPVASVNELLKRTSVSAGTDVSENNGSETEERKVADVEVAEAKKDDIPEAGTTEVDQGGNLGKEVAGAPETTEQGERTVGIQTEPEDRPSVGKVVQTNPEIRRNSGIPDTSTGDESITTATLECCDAVHPKTGAKCCLAKGHDGKHKLS